MRKSGYITLYIKELIYRAVQVVIGSAVFEVPPFLYLRLMSIRLMFGAGRRLFVGQNFFFTCPHLSKDGWLKIGNNVSMHRRVEIDYSGGVEIGDYVWISQNVLIESHEHVISGPELKEIQGKKIRHSPLHIKRDAWVGANVIILEKVKSIGEGAIVGAGSVVTKDVADFAIVAGNPARVIGSRLDS